MDSSFISLVVVFILNIRNNYYFKMMKQNKDEQLKKLIKLHNLANEMTNNKLVQPFKWNVSIKSK